MMTITMWIIVAVLVSIALGHVTGINVGFFAIAFSYIIGAFVMNMTIGQITATWPTRMFFIFFTITFFYSFATADGTLEKISLNVVYWFRNYPVLLPVVLFLLGSVISAMGAGLYAVLALLTPISIVLAQKSGMHPLLAAFSASSGAGVGSNFLFSFGGQVINGLIENCGLADVSQLMTMKVFGNFIIYKVVTLVILYFLWKGYKIKKVDVDKPGPFTKDQKANLAILGFVVAALIIPPFINKLTGNAFMGALSKKMDISYLAMLASTLVLLLKLGDQKKALARVPWGTIITICGMGMLVGIATKAGIITMIATWIGQNVSPALIPLVLVLAAATMSFFSSGYGVVIPTFFPLVPALAAASGLSPAYLFSLTTMAAFASGISPFSSGGGLIQAGLPVDDEPLKQRMFRLQLYFMVPFNIVVAAAVGYSGLLIH